MSLVISIYCFGTGTFYCWRFVFHISFTWICTFVCCAATISSPASLILFPCFHRKETAQTNEKWKRPNEQQNINEEEEDDNNNNEKKKRELHTSTSEQTNKYTTTQQRQFFKDKSYICTIFPHEKGTKGIKICSNNNSKIQHTHKRQSKKKHASSVRCWNRKTKSESCVEQHHQFGFTIENKTNAR